MLSAAGATIGYDPHGPDVVMASAFDEASRLFLDAAERCVAAERREKELQRRLTAADERVDVLETALKKISVRCVAYIEAEWEMPEPSVEVCQMIASAALKTAEPATDEHVCTGCGAKGWTANCSECVPY